MNINYEEDEYLTYSEAAVFLKVSKRTLQRLVKNRAIEYRAFGSQIRFLKSSLKEPVVTIQRKRKNT